MKYVDKKVINGKAYYYLQYQGYIKLIGRFLPVDLKSQLLSFFAEIAKKESCKLSIQAKEAFPYGHLQSFEYLKYLHITLKHELWKEVHDLFYFDEFIHLFNYHSNRSEGSDVTQKDIKSFMASNIRKPKTKTDQEIFNSLAAFQFALSHNMTWTMKSVKHIHKLLLTNLDPMIAGKWKQENNVVGNQCTSDYKDVPKKMKQLMDWLKKEFKNKKNYPPFLALKFYCQFERIHPFLDGNGRVGRILLSAILYKFNYPPVIFFTQNHQEHISGIKQALEGRWTKLTKHFLKQAERTHDLLLSKMVTSK